ncbi:AMP-binding enzyme [Spirillospora sp. CA-294931]|uniref:AMP-binding enzyme n=1 Tax=Spirillospora sp. CA-294931 TaxID=3240042 RepID=UPI003D8D758D
MSYDDVEAELARHPRISECAVLRIPTAPGKDALVAYVVTGRPIDAAEIREFLAAPRVPPGRSRRGRHRRSSPFRSTRAARRRPSPMCPRRVPAGRPAPGRARRTRPGRSSGRGRAHRRRTAR